MNIRLFKPSIGDEELLKIKEAFDRAWIGLGPNVSEFEYKWANYVGAETAIGLNSATAALDLAIRVFNFPKGKKVLVPSMTFSATASAVLYNGLIPVFVDSDNETLGMSIEDLKNKFDSNCVAVIPVHFAGHPVQMNELVPWARQNGLRIIEDCAHTTGSNYFGKNLGLWGDIGCFSFEEKKLMTTGDGGMMVTNQIDLFKDVKAMRWVGIDKDNWKSAQAYTDINQDAYHWFYELNVLGWKYNMNDLAAAIGLVQLQKLDVMNQIRSNVIRKYLKGIENLRTIKPLLPYNPDLYVYQMFGIRTDRKEDLILFLKSKGISTGCHYTPLTMQPLFSRFKGECPVAEREYEKMITLPLHAELTNEEVDYILHWLSEFENYG
jgi:perosamine synthetase